MGRSGKTLAIALAVLVAGLGAVALADSKTVSDGRDSRGNRFDVRSASVDHATDRVVHSLRTYGKWELSDVKGTRRKPRFICVYAYLPGRDPGGLASFQICGGAGTGKFKASVYDVDKRKAVGSVTVRRKTKRDVYFSIPLFLLGNPEAYSWRVATSDGSPATADYLPQPRGRTLPLVRHDLPGRTCAAGCLPPDPPPVG